MSRYIVDHPVASVCQLTVASLFTLPTGSLPLYQTAMSLFSPHNDRIVLLVTNQPDSGQRIHIQIWSYAPHCGLSGKSRTIGHLSGTNLKHRSSGHVRAHHGDCPFRPFFFFDLVGGKQRVLLQDTYINHTPPTPPSPFFFLYFFSISRRTPCGDGLNLGLALLLPSVSLC